jgi:hypothetical protein
MPDNREHFFTIMQWTNMTGTYDVNQSMQKRHPGVLPGMALADYPRNLV